MQEVDVVGKSVMLRRVLWPASDPANLDLLGREGFWICFAVAVWELAQWSGASWKTAVLTSLFYAIGACGIREHSRVAAVIVFSWNILGFFGDLLMGLHPALISWVPLVLLVVPLRTTFAAQALINDATNPRRSSVSLIWRPVKWLYFAICGSLVLLSLVGTIDALRDRTASAPIEGDQRTVSKPSR